MLHAIIERLDRIEKKLTGNYTNRYLDINQVSDLVSCSVSTIRRAVRRGDLKCCRRLGKLLFEETSVRGWLNG
jgi:predicted DNA-binding transcriptional regulator AlpA|tara:strand:+ start:1545 stop:1763 length:219 start_codon:yes stop_codon:yes gene_type:complete